jgi:hypothetical protein
MAKQNIEEILEKKVYWLKERTAQKENELKKIQVETKKHEGALTGANGILAKQKNIIL